MFEDLGPNTKAALIGLGITNCALATYLVAQGVTVVGFDQKNAAELGESILNLRALGVELVLGPQSFSQSLEGFDYVFVTPGIRPDIPLVAQAAETGAIVTNEIDLLLHKTPSIVVGITGSSGKTTTTSLVGHILAKAGKAVLVGGNIGEPLIQRLPEMTSDSYLVLELSSFQLMSTRRSPQISLITNITPNHLDYHTDMDEYIQAKSRIFVFQNQDNAVIFNADDPILKGFVGQVKSRVALFSTCQPVEQGAYVHKEILYSVTAGETQEIMPVNEIPLRGRHNVENVLAAATIAGLCGIRPEIVRTAVQEFRPVEHRLEFVREIAGVKYYNDSIATSPARAIAGVKAFQEPIILIAGGYDKKLPFDEFVAVLPNKVKYLLLVGDTAPAIAKLVESLPDGPDYSICTDLAEAVQRARNQAAPGDIVLLSPACASFDQFPNYRERGRVFKRLVNLLPN